jgi:hypothetical protein
LAVSLNPVALLTREKSACRLRPLLDWLREIRTELGKQLNFRNLWHLLHWRTVIQKQASSVRDHLCAWSGIEHDLYR